MNKSITATRLYSLGNYQNISFSDTIEDIPERIALDNKAMGLLRSIQLFQIEKSYQQYYRLKEAVHGLTTEKALELIDELDVTSTQKFAELFNSVPLGEEPVEDEEK